MTTRQLHNLNDVSSDQIAHQLLGLGSSPSGSTKGASQPCLLDHLPHGSEYANLGASDYIPHNDAQAHLDASHYDPRSEAFTESEASHYVPHFETFDEFIVSDDAGRKLLDMAIESGKGGTPASVPLDPFINRKYAEPNQDFRTTNQYLNRIQELSSKLSLQPHNIDSVRTSLKEAESPSASHVRTASPHERGKYGTRRFDTKDIRRDFPVLNQKINGHPIVWFDNAATTQKPQSVIDAVTHFYTHDYSNIHRAAHTLAARSTDAYEDARQQVAELIHADKKEDIVFVRGTTEGINFIAHTVKSFLSDRDEILLSELEHHANIVPWQIIARETGARIRVIPINDRGEIIFDEYRRLLSSRTKIVSLTHASNTLGTILPIGEMTQMAKRHNAWVVIDGAQSIAHLPVDVKSWNCDFFVFSGHKVFAPTGIGAVYVRPELQDKLPPWQGGGNMIVNVRFDDTTYADAPAKFEAGTPSIADAIGLGAAIRYLRQFNVADLEAHEHTLLEYATRGLQQIKGVTIYGAAAEKVGVVSFTLAGYETTQVGKELDRHGIAVRTGHHCAQPSLRHFGLEATIRPSFSIYNTLEEVERLLEVVRRLAK